MEASEFRDAHGELNKLGVQILGISPDSPAAQKRFRDKYDLPFALLSDTAKEVATTYGVWKEKLMYGKKVMGIERTTFLVSDDGVVRKVFSRVRPQGHAAQVLAAFEEMKK